LGQPNSDFQRHELATSSSLNMTDGCLTAGEFRPPPELAHLPSCLASSDAQSNHSSPQWGIPSQYQLVTAM